MIIVPGQVRGEQDSLWSAIRHQFKGTNQIIGHLFEDWKRYAKKTDRPRSDLSVASITWAICSTCEHFKDTPVEQGWTQGALLGANLRPLVWARNARFPKPCPYRSHHRQDQKRFTSLLTRHCPQDPDPGTTQCPSDGPPSLRASASHVSSAH